jgi:GABA(A) receptor-associated protein
MFSRSKPKSNSNATMTSQFKSQYTLEERQKQSSNILNKYKDSVPVYIDFTNLSKPIEKSKFVIPNGFTMGQLLTAIRMKMNLNPACALFIFINNRLIPVTNIVSAVYETNKDEDGFLYVCCSEENTFG